MPLKSSKTSRWLLIGAIASVGMLLTACTPQDESVAHVKPSPDKNSTAPPSVSEFYTEYDDEPIPDTVSQHVTEWEHYEKVSDGTLRVFYLGGVEKCYGNHAQVHETDTQVEIAIVSGYLPTAPEFCEDLGRSASMIVQLDSPLGDREVAALENPTLVP